MKQCKAMQSKATQSVCTQQRSGEVFDVDNEADSCGVFQHDTFFKTLLYCSLINCLTRTVASFGSPEVFWSMHSGLR